MMMLRAVGTRIEARYQASKHGPSRTKWFPGHIASAPSADGCYDVQYDDGDFEQCVPSKFIRSPAKPVPPARPTASDSAGKAKCKGVRPASHKVHRQASAAHAPSVSVLEMRVLQPLIDCVESGFGRSFRGSIRTADLKRMAWALTCKISMVCSGWDAAVRDLRAALCTVDAPQSSEACHVKGVAHHLDDAAVRMLARAFPNLLTVSLHQPGYASKWHASRHLGCLNELQRSRGEPGRCFDEHGRGWGGEKTTCMPPVGDEAIENLLRSCPLQQLRFSGEWRIRPRVLFTAARQCPQLKRADLSCCAWVPTRCELGDEEYAAATEGSSFLHNYYLSHLTAASLISLFTGCAQLTEIDVRHLPCVTDEVAQSMAMLLSQLRTLRLGGRERTCRLTERTFDSAWPSLITLDVSAFFLNGSLSALKDLSCPLLETLTWLPVARGLEHVASAAPRLEKLKLAFYAEDAVWSGLEEEEWDGAPPPLSDWLRSLKHPNLTCLDLSDCDWGDWGAGLLSGLRGAHLPRLIELNVSMDPEYAEQCAGVDNRSVVHLACNFPLLQSLDLEGNHQVGNKAVKALAEHCSGLVTLNLQRTSIRDDELVVWLPKLPKLMRLAIGDDCFGLSGAELLALATECSQLLVFDFEVGTGEFVGPDGWEAIEAVESLLRERRQARRHANGEVKLPSFAWSFSAG